MKIFFVLSFLTISLFITCDGVPVPAPVPAKVKATVAPPWAKFIKPTTTTEAPTTTTIPPTPVFDAEAFLQAWFIGPKVVPVVSATTTAAPTTTAPTTTSAAPTKPGKPTKAAKVKPTKKPLPWMIKKTTTTEAPTTTAAPEVSPQPDSAAEDKQLFINKLFAALSNEIANVTGQLPLAETSTAAPAPSRLISSDKALLEHLVVLSLLKKPVVTEPPTTVAPPVEPVLITAEERDQLLALLGPTLFQALNKSLIVAPKEEINDAPATSSEEASAEKPTSAETLAILSLLKPNIPIPDATESPDVTQLLTLLQSLLESATTVAPNVDSTEAATSAPPEETTEKTTLAPKTKKPKKTTTSAPEATTKADVEEATTKAEEATTEESEVSKLVTILKALLDAKTAAAPAAAEPTVESTSLREAVTEKEVETTTSAPETTEKAASDVTAAEPSDIAKLTAILKALLEATTPAPSSVTTEEATTSAPETTTAKTAKTTPAPKTKKPKKTTTSAPEPTTAAPDLATTEPSDASKLAAILKSLLESQTTEEVTEKSTEDATEKSGEVTSPPETPTSAPPAPPSPDQTVTVDQLIALMQLLNKTAAAPLASNASTVSNENVTLSKNVTISKNVTVSKTPAPSADAAPEETTVHPLQALLDALSPTTTTEAPTESATSDVDALKALLASLLSNSETTTEPPQDETTAGEAEAEPSPEEQLKALLASLADNSESTTEAPAPPPSSKPSDGDVLKTLVKFLKEHMNSPTPPPAPSADDSVETTPAPAENDATTQVGVIGRIKNLIIGETTTLTSVASGEVSEETTDAPNTKDVINLLVAALKKTTEAPTEAEATTTALAIGNVAETKCDVVLAENGPLLTSLLQKLLCEKNQTESATP